jgi:NADH-quinone oxidoreductase subunit J
VILADALVAQNIAFGVMAAVIVVGALRVVTTTNVVHAALWLVLVLAGVGATFLLLGAEFVGITQVLVYIGAIVVLFLFGIMLTRAPIGRSLQLTGANWGVALFVAVLLAGVLAYSLIDGFGDDKLPTESVQTTDLVSDSIFGQYIVPFEVVSLLLLAALVGAIVLARRD